MFCDIQTDKQITNDDHQKKSAQMIYFYIVHIYVNFYSRFRTSSRKKALVIAINVEMNKKKIKKNLGPSIVRKIEDLRKYIIHTLFTLLIYIDRVA